MVGPGAAAFQVTSQTPAARVWLAASQARHSSREPGWNRSPASMPLLIVLGGLPAAARRRLALLHLGLQLVEVEAVLAARGDEGGLDEPSGHPVRQRPRGHADGLRRLSGGQQSIS